MTDLPFVAASYLIVIGGLAAYITSIARREAVVRRTARANERARHHDLGAVSSDRATTGDDEAAEADR